MQIIKQRELRCGERSGESLYEDGSHLGFPDIRDLRQLTLQSESMLVLGEII